MSPIRICCTHLICPLPQVMHFLNELYQVFDDLVDEFGMFKLDIVGDCYIVVAGLIKEDQVRLFFRANSYV